MWRCLCGLEDCELQPLAKWILALWHVESANFAATKRGANDGLAISTVNNFARDHQIRIFAHQGWKPHHPRLQVSGAVPVCRHAAGWAMQDAIDSLNLAGAMAGLAASC